MGRILQTADRFLHLGMNVRGLSSRFVQGADIRLHVYDGRGRGTLPTTVLVHGLGAAGPSFARVVPRLLPHVKRILIPELPGHGRSTAPSETRLSPDRLLDAMTASLDAIVDEPAILYGNSLGGAVALAYAIRRPERVRALILVSPAGARMLEGEWRELLQTFDVDDRRSAQRFLERSAGACQTQCAHHPMHFLARPRMMRAGRSPVGLPRLLGMFVGTAARCVLTGERTLRTVPAPKR